jgi:abequosyltransferase
MEKKVDQFDSVNVVPVLSICIATYNRGKFIAETLNSIFSQMQLGVEVVIVDGASPDNTSEIIAPYLQRYPEIHYYRELENSGVDIDYDKAVGYAKGEFCWLMTDDDLLCPGAIKRLLAELDDDVDLVVVNEEVKNINFSKTLDKNHCKIPVDKKYNASNNVAFFQEMAQALSFIGCVVIRRDVWLSRDRASFYGTLFIHVGVIFQSPPIKNVSFIAEPLIVIRYGNGMWTPRGFEIWMFKWPELIWSFSDYSDSSKARVLQREPWRNIINLVYYRALGVYSVTEYSALLAGRVNGFFRQLSLLVAIFPASLINTAISLHCVLVSRKRMRIYNLLKCQKATWVTRIAANILDVSE